MNHLHAMFDAILGGKNLAVGIGADGRVNETLPAGILPGAFNPVHAGHFGLASAAERLLGLPVAFELSVVNVDKPMLALPDVDLRVVALAAAHPSPRAVWVTRLPTFVEKARLFPGVVFVVGADTAERVLAPRYYSGGETGMIEGLARIRAQGCRFLVAGRVDAAGNFRSLDDLAVPPAFRDLFEAIPPELFRLDISSSALRGG